MNLAKTLLLLSASLFVATGAAAATPAMDSPLPLLSISDRGELILKGEDDFSFAPWRSDTNPGTVHVIQYFGATMSASETFTPFTDLLQESLEPGSYHVTTVINLDAALWGTTGFVVSELKKNKRMHPVATMVIDEEGTGIDQWGLGKAGTGLIVLDSEGTVQYFANSALNEEQMQQVLELIKAKINS